jgi:hypothetical protein
MQMPKLFLPLILALASLIGIGDLIHACVDSNSGAIRIVMDSASCGDEETLLEWNTGEDVAALQEQVSALQAEVDTLKALLAGVSREEDTLLIRGANLQVVSGSGETHGEPNGLGNIIIGYNEERSDEENVRTGSHMLVVGRENNYSSFGGIVAGIHNQTSNDFASVNGGFSNLADGVAATVNGGTDNHASGNYASVAGGQTNKADGEAAAVAGGHFNEASGGWSVVSGGESNTVNAGTSSASVSGGFDHSAAGNFDWLAGGLFEEQ